MLLSPFVLFFMHKGLQPAAPCFTPMQPNH